MPVCDCRAAIFQHATVCFHEFQLPTWKTEHSCVFGSVVQFFPTNDKNPLPPHAELLKAIILTCGEVL